MAVGSIEGVGHAEDTCEVLQGLLSLFGQILIALVQRGGGSFAVIAGKEGDEGGLLWGKIVP